MEGMMPGMPPGMNVEVDPNEDTEWNDILRKHKIIPEKPPSPTPIIEEAILEARRLAHENRLEGKDLDELAELEDDEDDAFLEQYRQKRLQELTTITNASIYNQVYHLQKPDYSRDVTEASSKAFVLVLLTSSQGTNPESQILIEIWRELAQKYGDVKFCQIRANLCIEGYPDKNTPTVLVYKDGDIRRQLVTLRELRGVQTGVEDLEHLLIELGALKHSDPRLRRKDAEDESSRNNGRRGLAGSKPQAATVDDDDSDWD